VERSIVPDHDQPPAMVTSGVIDQAPEEVPCGLASRLLIHALNADALLRDRQRAVDGDSLLRLGAGSFTYRNARAFPAWSVGSQSRHRVSREPTLVLIHHFDLVALSEPFHDPFDSPLFTA